ncbi:C-type lectin domain-containing protein [Allocoleopsis sp.]|uniref:C-type lectin domain-containing protein n=1 Tax=Allocoleopsis sp. TaxID=3088169 RepID=UPI002FD271A4
MKSNQRWQNLSVAVATVLMSWGVGAAAQAFTFTNPTTGNEYFLTDAPLTWIEAQAQAVAAGGNLVTINNTEEQKWLLDVFGNTELFWIGLTDQQTEGVWRWASGEEVTYTNWTPYEPNNAQFFGGQYIGGENYVVMNWQNNGQWNDLANSFIKSRGIVEIVKDCIGKMTHIFDNESELACQSRDSK